MKAVRRTTEEQYKLILECRHSGLTDADWCREHDIRINTFYTWISRLRRKAGYPIPSPEHVSSYNTPPLPEVVKLEVLPEVETTTSSSLAADSGRDVHGIPYACPAAASLVEISVGGATFRFSGKVDPDLYEKTLRMIGGRL